MYCDCVIGVLMCMCDGEPTNTHNNDKSKVNDILYEILCSVCMLRVRVMDKCQNSYLSKKLIMLKS